MKRARWYIVLLYVVLALLPPPFSMEYGFFWYDDVAFNVWRSDEGNRQHVSMVNAFIWLPPKMRHYHHYYLNNLYKQTESNVLRQMNDGVIRRNEYKLYAFKKVYERLMWGEELITDEEGGIEMPNTLVRRNKNERTSIDDNDSGENESTTSSEAMDTAFVDISEEDMEFIQTFVLNEEHDKQLSKKVQEAIETEWDIQQGVSTARRRPLPLKANIDLWSWQARQELLRSNFSGSEALYRQCISYNPCDGRAWLGIARLYWKRGLPDLAEKSYKDGLYYNPKNPYLLQSWANMLVKQGKSKSAMQLLTTAVKKNPTHAASWIEMGKIHQRSSDTSSARYCYSQAVDSDRRSYVALQAYGVFEAELGNVDKARELFNQAIRIAPNSVHSLQALANLEKREGNLEGAQRLLEKSIFIFPGATRAMVTLAEVHELKNNIKEARKVFEDGQERAEKCGDAGFFQAWALFEFRNSYNKKNAEIDVESIRFLFKRGVDCNKYHSASWVAWAKFEQKCGNPEIAKRLLATGISKFPNSKNIGWFHCTLGHLSRQSGDIKTARVCYDKALSVTPIHKGIPVLLEYIRMETYHGGLREARELLELAVKRYSQDDRVWDAYEEFVEREATSGPVRGRPASEVYDPAVYIGEKITELRKRRKSLNKTKDDAESVMVVEQRPY